jgi:bifunctional DNA primase/polymerase-like protein/primase-like protein
MHETSIAPTEPTFEDLSGDIADLMYDLERERLIERRSDAIAYAKNCRREFKKARSDGGAPHATGEPSPRGGTWLPDQSPDPLFLPLYSGSDEDDGVIGFLQEHDGRFKAFDTDKVLLGRFTAFPAACDAIWADCLGVRPRPGQLRVAAAAAIVAFEKSGRMLDAALAWAAHGFPVFPVTVDKIPVPARDKDANGDPIPGTGGFKKATTDPIQIRAWWKHHEYLIGLPMGFASGVCCIDVDTSEDHADGVAEWDKLVAQHEPIVTREHRSATGGPHLIFDFDLPVGCSSGQLPKGIEVKGQGGYIVVPPSHRKGRTYTIHTDIDPNPLPPWLYELITAGRQRGARSFRSQSTAPYRGQITADAEEVADAMAWIPNDENVDYHKWKAMALRLYAALGDDGFKLFDTWSKQCKAWYNQQKTLEAWEQVMGSPPDHTGAGAIFAIARRHGWTPRLFECEPTYAAADGDADAA